MYAENKKQYLDLINIKLVFKFNYENLIFF